VYKDLEKKRVDVEGWGDAQEAYDIWHACIARYDNSEHKAKGNFTI
jgi:inorganic pyrophosphatase